MTLCLPGGDTTAYIVPNGEGYDVRTVWRGASGCSYAKVRAVSITLAEARSVARVWARE